MKIEYSYLYVIKEVLSNAILFKIFIESQLKLNELEDGTNPSKKITYLNLEIESKLNIEILKIERIILKSHKKPDLYIYLYQLQDLLSDIIEKCDSYKSYYEIYEKSFYSDKMEVKIKDYARTEIFKTDEHIQYIFASCVKNQLDSFKSSLKGLTDKYDVILAYKTESRIKSVSKLMENKKIYIKDFVLIAAFISVCIKRKTITTNGFKEPTNIEIFEYFAEHFWFENENKINKPLSKKSLLSYFSIRNSDDNKNRDKFLQLEQVFEKALESIN